MGDGDSLMSSRASLEHYITTVPLVRAYDRLGVCYKARLVCLAIPVSFLLTLLLPTVAKTCFSVRYQLNCIPNSGWPCSSCGVICHTFREYTRVVRTALIPSHSERICSSASTSLRAEAHFKLAYRGGAT